VEWLLHDTPQRSFDYYYDQIVCTGEMMSTCIVSNFLNEVKIENTWIDVRDIIRTDNNFRDAAINWEITGKLVQEKISPLLQSNALSLRKAL